jgi:DeoR/GlpR family transcriptional regulator of sugar metabolism
MLPDERRRLIAERLRQHGSVSVSGLEAEFRVSPMTARRDLDELEAHFADHVLFSVRGLTDEGFLTGPDPLESEVKRAMIRRARQAVVLVDGSKFDRPALTQIAHVDEVGMIVAVDVEEASLKPLLRAGIEVRRV